MSLDFDDFVCRLKNIKVLTKPIFGLGWNFCGCAQYDPRPIRALYICIKIFVILEPSWDTVYTPRSIRDLFLLIFCMHCKHLFHHAIILLHSFAEFRQNADKTDRKLIRMLTFALSDNVMICA